MTVIFYLAAQISQLNISLFEAWVLVGGATTVGVLSALPFGLGAAELSAIGIGTLLGFEATEVTAAFVIYRLLFTVPLALAGAVAYSRLSTAAGESRGAPYPDPN